jgi:sulfur carrier protein ThiS
MPVKITVNIKGHLRDLYPHLEARAVIKSEGPVTAAEVIRRLGISSKMVLFVTKDERIIAKDTRLESNCEINLVSPPAGG